MKKKSGCCFGFFSALILFFLLILFVGAVAVGNIRIFSKGDDHYQPSRMLVSKQIPLAENHTATF